MYRRCDQLWEELTLGSVIFQSVFLIPRKRESSQYWLISLDGLSSMEGHSSEYRHHDVEVWIQDGDVPFRSSRLSIARAMVGADRDGGSRPFMSGASRSTEALRLSGADAVPG